MQYSVFDFCYCTNIVSPNLHHTGSQVRCSLLKSNWLQKYSQKYFDTKLKVPGIILNCIDFASTTHPNTKFNCVYNVWTLGSTFDYCEPFQASQKFYEPWASVE